MSKPDPILVKAANVEFNVGQFFWVRRPCWTTKVVAEFVDEIEDAFEKIQTNSRPLPARGLFRLPQNSAPPQLPAFDMVTLSGMERSGSWPSPILPGGCAIGRDENSSVRGPNVSFPYGGGSRNALFFTAHRLFQACVQIFSRERRTNCLGKVINVSSNDGCRTLPRIGRKATGKPG